MQYSLDKTQKLAENMNYPNIVISLNAMIKREGYSGKQPIFDTKHICIDMDSVERQHTVGKSLRKSIDSSYVITYEGNDEVVLVEYRFNYTNLRNLRSTHLKEKHSSSSSILEALNHSVHKNVYYVFDRNLMEQARRKFRNLIPNQMPSSYKAIDIERLKALHFT